MSNSRIASGIGAERGSGSESSTRRRDREPGLIPITAILGRPRDAHTDAADRRRAKTRDRKRRERRRKKGDGNVMTVSIVVDYALACELADAGFIGDWDLEDRAAVKAALQAYLDQRKKYE